MLSTRNNEPGHRMSLHARGACPVFVLAAIIGHAGQSTWAANTPDPEQPLPDFKQVEKTVRRQFAAQPGYVPGDVISTSNVQPVFDHLRRMDWQVIDQRSILSLVPEDRNFLVRQLRTDEGRKFMQQIKALPSAYDRLDRLTTLPNGRQTVVDLIRATDGYKMVEYMTTTQGGQNLGRQLGHGPRGKDFNKPTGRIYTADMLISRLRSSYDAEVERRKQQNRPSLSSAP